ncbi:MAG: hypothetical protein FWF53_04200 [Candidatus Azobacteroides sp.]|nr:hypothetical protein [Candidatus Azobacteroides sp.]
MAESNIFYQEFMFVLQNKISHRATLVNTITNILAIDKDAVYRRLRGEVNFTFTEMAIIARSMGISLDTIAGIENDQSKPAKVNISRQVNPTEVDYEMFEGHNNLLKSIMDEPDTKIMEAGNILPHYLYQDYEYITRYYLFKWNQSSSYGHARPFHEIIIPKRLRTLQTDTCQYAKHIKSTVYVLDNMIFQRWMTNINYFARVRLIKAEDVSLIKNDLLTFLNDLEKLAVRGKYEDTGNSISLFISDTYCDTSYSCLGSKNIHLTLFKAYVLNAVVSLDEDVFNETCHWIASMQRMSTLISVTGEKIRTAFFDTQRKLIQAM